MANGFILDASELIKQLSTRLFIQPGGAGSQRYFYGIGANYVFLDGLTIPINGGVEPIYVPNPYRAGTFRLADRTRSAPALPSWSAQYHEQWAGIPRAAMGRECPVTFYEVHGRCGDLSDLYRGWDSYIWIAADGLPSGDIDGGTRTSVDGDGPLMLTVPYMGRSVYPVGAQGFGEEAAADVVNEVIDIIYGTTETCAECGPDNDGAQWIYGLTRSNVGSPSAPGQIVYSVNGGLTWLTNSITGIGVTAEPRYIGIVGSVIFVGTSATTLFYSTINSQTGAPGTWTSVTTPVAFSDAYVNGSDVYFTATAGRIYKTADITIAPSLIDDIGGANAYNRVHGFADIVVAVGAAGLVRYTLNRGVTWITATVPEAASLTTVQVVGPRLFWVGTSTGKLWKSINRGVSWTQASFPGSGSGAITDLVFATREVAWALHTLNSVARLIGSLDGGNSFARDDTASSWILNWPTFAAGNRLAVPSTSEPAAANYTAIAGLASGGTDGIILASTPVLR